MCDYSLHSVKSRPAKVGDKLTTHNFGTGTRGFAAAEDMNIAVCVLPGTELSFAGEIRCLPTGLIAWRDKIIEHKTAIFRQINKEKVATHHDALEFPDGQIVLLTSLSEPASNGSSVAGGAKERRRIRSPTARSLCGLNKYGGRPNAGGHSYITSSTRNYSGEMPCQSTSRVVGSLRTP
jgi:hypothetical protein